MVEYCQLCLDGLTLRLSSVRSAVLGLGFKQKVCTIWKNWGKINTLCSFQPWLIEEEKTAEFETSSVITMA